MKRSNLLLILFILCASCSERKAPTLMSHWMKKNSFSAPDRSLANTSQGQCMQNNFNVDLLKPQVKDLEKMYESAPKVKGMWRHINLASLPVPQANFLKNYGERIGDLNDRDAIDYSGCSDVPCLFNKIYGTENGVAGYVHYLWYLRFNHMLSADNMIPDEDDDDSYGKKLPNTNGAGIYNRTEIPLKEYLYTEDELYGLWRLSMMLNGPHRNLPYLHEIQRIPRYNIIEGENKETCGMSSSAGWIIVNDGCVENDDARDEGFLYIGLTHEMNHQIDFQLGRGLEDPYRSHKSDYLNASGFRLNEWVDKSGIERSQWEHLPGAKFIRDYAAQYPHEAFADTLAYFRAEGDKTKAEITKGHYDFISKNIYSNETYEKAALVKNWIQKSSSDLNQSVLKVVLDCSKNNAEKKSKYFSLDDFTIKMMPAMLNCISSKSETISQRLASDIALNEPEGCSTLNARDIGDEWDSHLKVSLKVFFEKHLKDLNTDPNYVAKIESYYKGLSDNSVSVDAFINCYNSKNEQQCFNNEVKKGLSEKSQELSLSDEDFDEFAQMYVDQHPYSNVKDETLANYRTYLLSHLEDIRKAALDTWNACKEIKQNDEASPTGNLFTVHDYLISSFYNCLNAQIPNNLKTLVKSVTSKDFELKNGNEELILTDNIKPEFLKILDQAYQSERAQESESANAYMASENGELRKSILSDFSWMSNASDFKVLISECRVEATKKITFIALYHLKSDLFKDFIEKNVCLNINQTPEFNDSLQKNRGPYVESIMKSAKDILYQEGTAQAKECLSYYPMNNLINKVRYKFQREECLDNAWRNVQDKTLKKVLSDPMIKKFAIPESDLILLMSSEREATKARIKKENFKIEVKLEVPFKDSF